MDDLNAIRSRCDLLLAAANVSGDKKRIDKLIEVQNFLKNDNCFNNTDEIDCTYFLLRLGYDFDEAEEIYNSFNKIQTVLGILEYIDKSGKIHQVEAMLCPMTEDYYMFDNGLIFKFDNRSNKFYSLIDGDWVHNGSLQKKFYSSEYNYQRIKYKIDEKKTFKR